MINNKKVVYRFLPLIFALGLVLSACQIPKPGELMTVEQSQKVFKKYCKKNDLTRTNFSAQPGLSEDKMWHYFTIEKEGSVFNSQNQGIWIDRRSSKHIGAYQNVNPIEFDRTNK